jgi:hypothetical protein
MRKAAKALRHIATGLHIDIPLLYLNIAAPGAQTDAKP